MSSAETISRQWDILQRIPQLPQRATVADIHERLPASEYTVSRRTVQRDLEHLSNKFPINSEPDGRTNHWFWMKGARQVLIPHMSGSMAATMLLVRDYLKPVLPTAVLGELNPFFAHATEVLDNTPLKGWNRKVRILDRGPMLIPPKVNNEVRNVVYQALLENRQIKAGYKARGKDKHKEYTLNPLGMVLKGGVFYLVARFDGHDNARQLALHRMNKAELLSEGAVAPKGFTLKGYIEDEAGFSYPLSPEKIKLDLLFDADAGFSLTEPKLAPDPVTKIRKDGRIQVKATVADT
ncbi:MAG: WYL domain-containing protein, partial [Gammaproteobacteria bacterium]|nr:WYL domain-containing protein [Gammaproteobacteria bacterium]